MFVVENSDFFHQVIEVFSNVANYSEHYYFPFPEYCLLVFTELN